MLKNELAWRETVGRDTAGDAPPDRFAIEVDTVPLIAPGRSRVSALATLSLVLGLTALSATLTGLLAPVGVALGAVTVATAVYSLVRTRRFPVTGHSLAVLAILCGGSATVLGVMAIGGHLSWLNGRVDEVSQLHDWLDSQLPVLKRW
jgi:ABC-type Fe3+-siderophore transport system permease subunit